VEPCSKEPINLIQFTPSSLYILISVLISASPLRPAVVNPGLEVLFYEIIIHEIFLTSHQNAKVILMATTTTKNNMLLYYMVKHFLCIPPVLVVWQRATGKTEAFARCLGLQIILFASCFSTKIFCVVAFFPALLYRPI
jgi:hypothetical protein